MNPRAFLLLSLASLLVAPAHASADPDSPTPGRSAYPPGGSSAPESAASPSFADAPAPSQALARDRARTGHRFVLTSVGRAPFARAVGAAVDARIAPHLEVGALVLVADGSFELGAALTVRPLADAFEGLVLRTSAGVRAARAPDPSFRGVRVGAETGYAFTLHSVYVEATAGFAYDTGRGVEPSLGVRVGFAY